MSSVYHLSSTVFKAYVLQLLEELTCPPEEAGSAVGDPVICPMPCEPAQADHCPPPGR